MRSTMNYQKLSKKALGCMYTATAILSIIVIIIITTITILFFIPNNITIGSISSFIVSFLIMLDAIISPWFRYHRYRYDINDQCIDILEGYIFIERNIVPIERLHKLQTSQGPIDRLFGVAKLIVTTAGGDVTIRFLEEDIADKIAENLRERINTLAVEQKVDQLKKQSTGNEEN